MNLVVVQIPFCSMGCETVGTLRYHLLFVLVSKYLKFLKLVINIRVLFLRVLAFLFMFPRNKCA